jgi:hypothetical protein
MTKELKFNKLILNSFIVVFILTANSGLYAQEKKVNDLDFFKIILEKTDNGIKLICEKGCAWKELTYSINEFKSQAIDEYGMTDLIINSSIKDANLTDFLFTLIKTKEGIILKGVKGTAWIDLKFSLSKNQKQAIDQMGMTKLN